MLSTINVPVSRKVLVISQDELQIRNQRKQKHSNRLYFTTELCNPNVRESTRGVGKYGSMSLKVKGHVAGRRQELIHDKTYNVESGGIDLHIINFTNR